ncbi:hypothetical protein E1218_35260 [Kribbella turkmenica]|uniref:Uncharacterized protein n=1 Tax=Kribbella turkmenica TaxID=2530375 RepID=A0A4R4WBL5_9ACTN|nr:hypothetical protein [Kribbella turkmenica]TDD12695.1 hypothetical protein E1218_35260 [Kribbella turkmenica]
MKLQRLALAVAGVGMLAATAASGPAVAGGQADPKPSWTAKTAGPEQRSPAATTAACASWVGWPTAAGTVEAADVYPGRPPTAELYEPFNFVATRANATWYLAQNSTGTQVYFSGLLLQGGNLYRHTTYVRDSGLTPTFKKVGTGWTSFKSIATSNYSVTQPRHAYLYGLNTNGSLYRYAQVNGGFRALGSFPGFRGFKAMTMISESATYDTLLMTTKAGALYTIRIPITATAKPVVKLIRSSGWSAYESLVVQGCGTRGGSLVVGVDADTDSGYHYAMSKANGTATAITAYGKIPAVFNGVDHVSFTTYYDQLVGE